MQKKLFTQIRNEWRGNVWLALELLVVSVVLWYIIDMLYCRAATYLEPRGFNTEHCYRIYLGYLTNKSPDYDPDWDVEQWRDDVLEIVERLRRRPEVEAVSLSCNAHPYNGNNSGCSLQYDTLQSSGFVVRRYMTPDFVRVFRYQGARGETPDQLAELLEKGHLLASNNIFMRRYGIPLTEIAGNGFHLDGDTTRSFTVTALQPVRYHDYEEAKWSYTVCYNLASLLNQHSGLITVLNELCVRVKADKDRNFIDNLRADSEKQFRIGNVYISDIRSFTDIRRSFQQSWSSDTQFLCAGMAFLMLNIFLGLLGTFWFRTQQRRGEIALHKIHGATNRAVFARLMSEGMLLLLVITPLALVVDYLLASAELNAWRNGTTLEPERLLLCAALAFVFIALMILIGIWYPARRAMKIQPAEALHDE